MYRELGKKRRLVEDDIKAAPMGQKGVDIIFSPAAKAIFNHDIECKKHAQVRIPAEFKKHYKKYKDQTSLKLLFSENNNSEALVTMQAKDFMTLLERILYLEEM